MTLVRVPEPFDDSEFVFELKYDGFRALAYLEQGHVELVSRKGRVYKQFPELCRDLAELLRAREAIIDGEIACLDEAGRPVFDALMHRRESPCFIAFDLLWIDGEDIRELPLVDRKRRLRKLIPRRSSSVLYLTHVSKNGRELYRLACEQDLEGIVAKKKAAPYRATGRTSWLKVKNPAYSHAAGRREKFERGGRPRPTC